MPIISATGDSKASQFPTLHADTQLTPEIALTPMIVAGDPTATNLAEADSPDLRIDPNEASSPFAGVGSISVGAPGGGSFLCSGTAISPRHVLTAGHCLDTEAEDGVIDVSPSAVTFNLNIQGPSAPAIAIPAAALAVFDNGVDRYAGFTNSVSDDLAILTLSEDLPAGVPIYDISRQPLTPQTIITLVGYGTTGNGIDGHISGTASPTTKRVGKNQVDDAAILASFVDEVDEVFTFDFDGPDPTTNALSANGSGLTLGNRVETTLGPGDSGGPSFIRGKENEEWVLAGVNTFGYAIPNVGTPSSAVVQGTFGTGGGGVILSDPEKLAWLESIVGDALRFADLGSLTGTLWHDLNGDGDRAFAEPVLSGWTTYLDLNRNGLLDPAEPTTLTDTTGTYRFSNLEAGTYSVAAVTPAGWQPTTSLGRLAERFNADFSDVGGSASQDGFVIDNSGAPVPGLWQLTAARGSQPGHSSFHSLYFGQRATASGGGNYDVGHTAGRVTSPMISLAGLETAVLTFNYRLNIEPDLIGDRASVRILTTDNAIETIALKGEGLQIMPSSHDRWSSASLPLNDFVGEDIRIQFDFDTLDPFVNNFEGWFIDDVAVQGTTQDSSTIALAAGQDLAGVDIGYQLMGLTAASEFNPPNNPDLSTAAIVGFFDYEYDLRYQGAAIAAVPTDTVGTLPLAQLFDEGYYLYTHPDVAAAVDRQEFASGYEHFVASGLAEGRNPSLLYSEQYYLANADDVAQAVADGSFASGLQHFLLYGHRENRAPSAYFDPEDYLTRNVDVAIAVQQGQEHSAFEHYVRFGVDELGRLPNSPAAALFNEAFYLQTNPEVVEAIAGGAFADGFDHFVRVGQSQNLSPSLQLNLETYLANNPEAQSAVDAGGFASGFDYFVQVGRFENLLALG